MKKIFSSIFGLISMVGTTMASPFFGADRDAFIYIQPPSSPNAPYVELYGNGSYLANNGDVNWPRFFGHVPFGQAIEFSVYVPSLNQWYFDGIDNIDSEDHMFVYQTPNEYEYFVAFDARFGGQATFDFQFYVVGLDYDQVISNPGGNLDALRITTFPNASSLALIVLGGIVSIRRKRR